MPASIYPLGSLKQYTRDKSPVEVAAGVSVRQALINLEIPPEIVALVLVNEQNQDKQYVLQEGDEVKIIAILGGG